MTDSIVLRRRESRGLSKACAFFVLCWVLFSSDVASAQWLNYPTAGIARTADGKPDLSAPAPRNPDGTPNLSGLWRPMARGYQIDVTADLNVGDIRPWAAAIATQRAENFGNDSPGNRCLPLGATVRSMMSSFKVIQMPRLVVMLYERGDQDRQIFMDGRTLPADPNPTWMGYSVGHWEGDTLVVESTGFNDKTWLDLTGHPHTEALRITERFTRIDSGHMHLAMTIEDADAYAKPWTVPVDIELMPDTELLEYVCEREDVRQTEPLHAVHLSEDVLSSLEGRYDITPGRAYIVTRRGNQLFIKQLADKVAIPLAALSETRFVQLGGAGEIQFIKGADGSVTGLIFTNVEGETRATRGK